MASSTADPSRIRKLQKLFDEVVRGQRSISTPANARLFLEAVESKTSPSICVELLISSSSALEAVRKSIRVDISLNFITSRTLPLLSFLSAPEVKLLADGRLLQKLLDEVVHPPTLWNALIGFFLDHQLPQDSFRPFAWLVHEIISLSVNHGADLLEDVKAVDKTEDLLKSAQFEVRELGYKIRKALELRLAPTKSGETCTLESAGGRHDNDFADFRRIDIFPTNDELHSTMKSFYRLASEVSGFEPAKRAGIHLDNQFRLLREDMLAELREDLQRATGKRKGKSAAIKLGNLVPVALDHGDTVRAKKCSLYLECHSGLNALQGTMPSSRKQFLENHKNYVKHNAFGALCLGHDIYGFAFVIRDLNLLLADPPIVQLQFTDERALSKCLMALRPFSNLQFIVVDTPVFAYQPVLEGLRDIKALPLQDQLLDPTVENPEVEHCIELHCFVSELKSLAFCEDEAISIDSTTKLDHSQLESLHKALSSSLSVIQGPPGTGKSFIGSLIMKHLFEYTKEKFMIISYTNHALDQFLEELLDVGIDGESMIRLGSKCTTRTSPLLLKNSKRGNNLSKTSWDIINTLRRERRDLEDELKVVWSNYHQFQVKFSSIMEYLEFCEGFERYHEAFTVPMEDFRWKRVGKKGKAIQPDYLYGRWISGQDAGIYKGRVIHPEVWTIAPAERQSLQTLWASSMVEERVEAVQSIVKRLDDNQATLEGFFNKQNVQILNSKRIIACTTTAAAMHNKLIRAVRPDTVLVEEAGEILECHILTALTSSVKRLVLIGDHKQLRPKINSYELTVEKGLGYDLNKSLFERLVLEGYRHTTLRKQHRMHPAISAFPRALTYPDLLDAPNVANRQSINGIQDRVIFVHHEQPEVGDSEVVDRRDPTTSSSKQNDYEARMILKIVMYLSQQGYKTDKMAVLTPYLGQLRLLRDRLAKENNPVLNDLDAHDLLQAGLITQAAAKVDKQPLRLSTIGGFCQDF